MYGIKMRSFVVILVAGVVTSTPLPADEAPVTQDDVVADLLNYYDPRQAEYLDSSVAKRAMMPSPRKMYIYELLRALQDEELAEGKKISCNFPQKKKNRYSVFPCKGYK